MEVEKAPRSWIEKTKREAIISLNITILKGTASSQSTLSAHTPSETRDVYRA